MLQNEVLHDFFDFFIFLMKLYKNGKYSRVRDRVRGLGSGLGLDQG